MLYLLGDLASIRWYKYPRTSDYDMLSIPLSARNSRHRSDNGFETSFGRF
jgi:hypothetical protein